MDANIFFKTAIIVYIVFLCALFWWNGNQYVAPRESVAIKREKVQIVKNVTTTKSYNATKALNAGNSNSDRQPISFEGYLPKYIGPGADGGPVKIPENDELYKEIRGQYLKYEVNNLLSKMVGMKRVQPDRRPEACKSLLYPADLPPVSIILTFRDEPEVTLLRTVYSILETTPEHLIEEIILIDDGSVNEELLVTVKVHVANVEKLSVIRNEQSVGLMKARQRGILAAKADYFIVLDGHVEVTPGWLEPVLFRLKTQPKSLLTSHIGIVNCENFGFFVGGFTDWMFTFDQISLNEHWVHYSKSYIKSRNGSVEPIPYGIVPGNMMAMKKSFFLQLGGFDQGMEIWGAEHQEMSVKVWLCGGRVEMVPCSIVGHVYRPAPWGRFHPKKDYVTRNLLRFAMVWMDGLPLDMAMQVRRSDNYTKLMENVGDVSERKQIKVDNKCHPYQYFLDQLRSISDTYIPTNPRKKGVVKNKAKNMCLDRASIDGKFKLITYPCGGNMNQYMVYTEDSGIVVDRIWFTAEQDSDKVYKLKLIMEENDFRADIFKWGYDEKTGVLKHLVSGKCLTCFQFEEVTLEECTEGSLYQKWEWTSYA